MAAGDHIYVVGTIQGIPFQHHGIDAGDGSVIHLCAGDGARVTLKDSSERFSVRRTSIQEFANGREIFVKQHSDGRNGEQVVKEAEKRIGECGYNLLEGNCEHFATACATGRWESHQIEMGAATVEALASASTKVAWAAGQRLVARYAARSALKVHPAAVLADCAEVAALSASCRSGFSADKAKRIAKLSGAVTAFGIGGVVGGGAGAVAFLAIHHGSSAVAEKFCKTVRNLLS